MTRIKRLFLNITLFYALLLVNNLHATSFNTEATITVSTPLSVSNTTDINFGTSGITAVAGAVITMASNGDVTCTASACGIIAGNANGVMAISGGTSGDVSLSFSSPINLTGGGSTLTFAPQDGITASNDCQAYAPAGCNVGIYGAITLPDPVSAGTYTGTYTVTISQ